MTIDLRAYEHGRPFDGDYALELDSLQQRMSRLFVANRVHRRKAIILFEGWPGSGKGGAMQRLTAQCDPRIFKAWSMAAPRTEESERHHLWPFWMRLPAPGEITLFDHSWYRRVLGDRFAARVSEEQWLRAFDEINEFEALLAADGVVLIKLFLHVTAEVQEARLVDRRQHPWKRWKTGSARGADRASVLATLNEMFAQTDTAWARWTVIDANDKPAARIAVLQAVVDRLGVA